MTNDLAHANAENDPPVLKNDRETARKLFERSLHLDIFNVGSVTDSLTKERLNRPTIE